MSIYQSDKKQDWGLRFGVTVGILSHPCSPDLELLPIKCRLHVLPREFSLVIITAALCWLPSSYWLYHMRDKYSGSLLHAFKICYKAELLPEWWLSGWHCHLRAKMSLVRFPTGGWLLLWCTAWPTSTSKCAKHSDYQLGTTLELKVIQTCIEAQLPRQWEGESHKAAARSLLRVRIKELHLAGAWTESAWS